MIIHDRYDRYYDRYDRYDRYDCYFDYLSYFHSIKHWNICSRWVLIMIDMIVTDDSYYDRYYMTVNIQKFKNSKIQKL